MSQETVVRDTYRGKILNNSTVGGEIDGDKLDTNDDGDEDSSRTLLLRLLVGASAAPLQVP